MNFYQKQLTMSIFWTALGCTFLTLSIASILASDFFTGMGCSLIGVGISQVFRAVKYRKDPKYREMVEININDERNRYIRNSAWAWTGYIVVLAFCAGSVVCAITKQASLCSFFSLSACFIIVVYWIAYLIIYYKS